MAETTSGAKRLALYVMYALIASGCPSNTITSTPTTEAPDAGAQAPVSDAAKASPDSPSAGAPDRAWEGGPDLAPRADQALADLPRRSDLVDGRSDVFVQAELPAADGPLPTFDCRPLSMVWQLDGNEIRREGYTFVADSCAGYRCVVGNAISPSCYNERECPTACSGLCLLIPTMKLQCPIKLDAGGAIDGPAPIDADTTESIACDAVDMVWRTGDAELRRDSNCASQRASSSGFCYSFADDACDGYRCLSGNDITPSCSSSSACRDACGGRCVSIAVMRGRCARLDGGSIVHGG